MKSPSANYRNGCPHITEKTVRELPKPAETAHPGYSRPTSITMRKEITRGTDINP